MSDNKTQEVQDAGQLDVAEPDKAELDKTILENPEHAQGSNSQLGATASVDGTQLIMSTKL